MTHDAAGYVLALLRLTVAVVLVVLVVGMMLADTEDHD